LYCEGETLARKLSRFHVLIQYSVQEALIFSCSVYWLPTACQTLTKNHKYIHSKDIWVKST